jgi:uncharacterized protein
MKHGNIIWFEIPVKDLDRAIKFYSEMLGTLIEKKTLHKKEYGIFDKKKTGIGGVLVERPKHARKGVTLYFFVNVLSDAIEAALAEGGKIVTPKMILKQTNTEGKTILAHNLLDDQVGYFAQLVDSEGNRLALYSHH